MATRIEARMITGILLAAGSATRFGSDKLLHLLPDGTPIAVAAARNLKAAIPTSLAVVHPDNLELVDLFATEGLTVVACRTATQGMGASLACGVRASSHAQGWIIALADMPFIQPATILAVHQPIDQGLPLSAPVFQGRRGHPVGFGHEFFDVLANLSGDEGARSILNANADRILMVDCADPGILADIDSTDDLLRHQTLVRV